MVSVCICGLALGIKGSIEYLSGFDEGCLLAHMHCYILSLLGLGVGLSCLV